MWGGCGGSASTYFLRRQRCRTSVQSARQGLGVAGLAPLTVCDVTCAERQRGPHGNGAMAEVQSTYFLQRRMGQTSVGSVRLGVGGAAFYLHTAIPKGLIVSVLRAARGGSGRGAVHLQTTCQMVQASVRPTQRGRGWWRRDPLTFCSAERARCQQDPYDEGRQVGWPRRRPLTSYNAEWAEGQRDPNPPRVGSMVAVDLRAVTPNASAVSGIPSAKCIVGVQLTYLLPCRTSRTSVISL